MSKPRQSAPFMDRLRWSEHWLYDVIWLISLGAMIYVSSTSMPGQNGPTGWTFPDWHPNWQFVTYWIVGFASLLLSPRMPAVPYIIYLVFTYGVIPRSHAASDFLRAMGMLEIVTVLGIVNLYGSRTPILPQAQFARSILLTTAAYSLWTWLSAAYWVHQSGELRAEAFRQCIRTTECLTITILIASAPLCRNRLLTALHIFIAAFLLEAAIAWPGLRHDAVTASIAAICFPLMIFALLEAPRYYLRALPLAGLITTLLVIYRAESRAVVAGLALGTLSWMVLSRRRWQWFGASLLPMLLMVYGIAISPLGARFRLMLWHEPGWDSGRIPLWTQAWEAFWQHPWMGSGPGAPSGPLHSAHNSYLSALSEIGLIGCGLYLLIWGLTLGQLAIVLRGQVPIWQQRLAQGMIAAIITQGTIGLGYSLQNWQLAFALIGLTLAVQRSASSAQLASEGI